MQAYIAEFIGTMILIILGDGVVAGVLLRNSKAENSGWIVITFGWGMAVAVAVYCVGQFSGAYINPAVTIAFAVTGQFEWALVPGFIIAQFLGAFVGAVIVWLAYLPHWAETEDAGLKLGVFCTAPAIYNTPANVITEIIGTFVLVFGIFGIVANAGAVGGSAAGGHRQRASTRCWSACSSSASGSRWVGRPATPSTRPVTWGRASPTPCCP